MPEKSKFNTLLTLKPCLFQREEDSEWEPGLIANEGWLDNLAFIDQEGKTIVGMVSDYIIPENFKPIDVAAIFKALKEFEQDDLKAG